MVLGEVQHRDQPIRPSPGQRIAVGAQRNIRTLNVYADPDEVVRRLPLTFLVNGKPMPSMAVELAARALGSEPDLAPDGTMTLARYRIPSAVPNTQVDVAAPDRGAPRRQRDLVVALGHWDAR